jgi:ABC-type multidrug transport system fused ATPase/permease subunit
VSSPHILLLDEATSALDEESQQKVQIALQSIMNGRTSLVIAHRLTTIEKCDRIVVLESGIVSEDGTFNELKGSEGYFAKMAAGNK